MPQNPPIDVSEKHNNSRERDLWAPILGNVWFGSAKKERAQCSFLGLKNYSCMNVTFCKCTSKSRSIHSSITMRYVKTKLFEANFLNSIARLWSPMDRGYFHFSNWWSVAIKLEILLSNSCECVCVWGERERRHSDGEAAAAAAAAAADLINRWNVFLLNTPPLS